jgi:hypothetical protein
MTTISSGISKLLVFKKQSGLNVIATVGSAQYLRRTQSTLNKKKATYASKEIRPSQQRSDFRHGVVGTEGTISGEVSVGTYELFEESLNRAASVALTPLVSAATDIVTAVTSGASGTITTTAANFLTAGFKIGMVIRCTGFTTTAVGNNATNLYITSINGTGKIMGVTRLDKAPLIAKTETAAVTFTEVGQHSIVPTSGHTRDYYTIEHNFADIIQSEVFTDCVVTQMDVKLPGSGMMTVDYMFKGLDMTTGTTGYFTSPTAVTSGSVLASANGLLYVNGLPVALITGMNFSVKGNHTTIGGIVGSNVEPDIFPGDLTVDGQITVLFADAVVRDYFLNETEVGIYCVFTTDNTATAGFKAYSFPRCKMGGADKDDGEKGLVMTMPFTALENVAGGAGTATHATTYAVQDSAFS